VARDWTWLGDRLVAAQRGISAQDVADETGIPVGTVRGYWAYGHEGHQEEISAALTSISARRGLTPPRAARVSGPLLEDGLPEHIELDDWYARAIEVARAEAEREELFA